MKTLIDKLGNSVTVGDRVAYSCYKNLGLSVGIIQSIGTKRAQVALQKVHARDWDEMIGTVESISAFDLIKL